MGVDVEFRRAHDLYVMGGYCEGSEAPEGAGYAGFKSGCKLGTHGQIQLGADVQLRAMTAQ